MTKTCQNQEFINQPIINTQTQKPISKTHLLHLLKKHHITTHPVKDPDITPPKVIPTLIKAKTYIPEKFQKELAYELNMPYIPTKQLKKIYKTKNKTQLISIIPYPIIVKYQIIPLTIENNTAKMAISNPLDQKTYIAICSLFGNYNIDLYVTTPQNIEWATNKIYNQIHKKNALLDLYNRTPDQSAHKVLYPTQKIALTTALLLTATALIINPTLTFTILFAAISLTYFILNPVKVYISIKGLKGARPPTRITQGEIQWCPQEDLPTYTILVPLYKEAKILPQLLTNLYHIDYPKEKLDIKILMEQNDQETIQEAKKIGLFGHLQKKPIAGIPRKECTEFLKLFDPIIIPPSKITTKPRACNYGLLRAKGECVVIYDAEDKPDPDQLKKAAIIFLRSDDNIVCLQSKLNFYNKNHNLLTRWFSIEYSYWFEYYLSGLDWIDAPIPLGGTSNHFRLKKLNHLGRWDPYNVTEDADIGIRLSRKKYKTQMVDTYTHEEAPTTIKAWIKQRSRWYKGHLQTYLVHMRHPRKLLRDLGTKKFLKFQLTFAGNLFMPFINPLLLLITAAALIFPTIFTGTISTAIFIIALTNLITGNLTYIILYMIACTKQKQRKFILLTLTMPIYWLLLSIASWRGITQLITKPFYWDKTTHGTTPQTK